MVNSKNAKLISKARKHVKSFFRKKKAKRFPYHNFAHTKSVVKEAIRIAKYYQLLEEDVLVLTLAAWFHDVGYFIDTKNHETKSAEEAERFLNFKNLPQYVEKIRNAILSTSLPQHPATQLEEILCDADLAYLGKKGFKKRSQLLRKELIILGQANITKAVWRRDTITFLNKHTFFTSYAKDKLEKRKARKLKKLVEKDLVD